MKCANPHCKNENDTTDYPLCSECRDKLDHARGEHDEMVSVPVALLRDLRDNWESGDLAGTVNDLLGFLPDDDETEEGAEG